jgi:hypothetical protein
LDRRAACPQGAHVGGAGRAHSICPRRIALETDLKCGLGSFAGRIEAACLPAQCGFGSFAGEVDRVDRGFKHEGRARAYLCIAGEWQDHLLFARLGSDPMP